MSADAEITVSYSLEGEDIHRLALGSAAMPDIEIDYTGLSKEQRVNTATRLLCAAALYCFVSTFGAAIKARGTTIKALTAKAVAAKGKDSYYRPKVTDIRIEVEIDVPEAGLDTLAKCEQIMERGCLITYSLSEGINVEHSITHSAAG